MKAQVRYCLLSLLAFVALAAHGQAPTISYATPQTYTVGTLIPQLSPTSNRVAAQSYNSGTTFATVSGSSLGLSLDKSGNVYFTDYISNTLSKIPAAGGTPSNIGSGYTGPYAVALDPSNNIYVADKEIYFIASGTTTLKGLNYGTTAGGFITVDNYGHVFFTVPQSNVVYELTHGLNGLTQIASGFQSVAGIVVDAGGNLYITDNKAGTVSKLAAGTTTLTTVCSGFPGIEGITVDLGGNLYFTDTSTNAVWEIPTGTSTPLSVLTGFNFPYSVAVDGSGNLFVDDTGNEVIKKFTPVGGYFANALPAGLSINEGTGVITGTPIASSSAKNYTVTAYNSSGHTTANINITVNAEALPTISYASPQTYKAGFPISPLTPSGSSVAPLTYSNLTAVASGLNKPIGVARDASGNLYYSSQTTNTVYKIAAGTNTAVSYGTGFNSPNGLAVDASGNLYVGQNGKVEKIPAGGGTPVALTISGGDVACDASGNVYVASAGIIYKIAPGGSPVGLTSPNASVSGIHITVDAIGNVYYTTNNGIVKYTASTTMLSVIASGIQPYGIAVDGTGNVFFSETNENDVKVILADGSGIKTIAAGLNSPAYVKLDASGDIFFADQFADAIEMISPLGGYFAAAPLPAGLALSSATGIISGTPQAAIASANYTITGINATGSGAATLNITVNLPPVPTLSYASPKSYATESSIIPLTPASTSVAPQNYSSPIFFGSGYRIDAMGMDPSGNIYYLSSVANGDVYKIPAGSTTASVIDTGFSDYQALAVDQHSNIYLAGHTVVKKIAAGTNMVSTFASGFKSLTGIATDVNGNVYIADSGNNQIEKIPVGGGTPVSLGSGFTFAYNVTVDDAGDVFVNDGGNLKKIPAGVDNIVSIGSAGEEYGMATDASGDVFAGIGIPAYQGIFGGGAVGIVEFPANGAPPKILFYSTSLLQLSGVIVDAKGDVFFANNGDQIESLQYCKPTGGCYFNSLPAGLKVDNSTGTISGIPTTTAAATNYTGIAYNLAGSATSTTSITIADPYLSGLTLNGGTLSPAFAPATTNYTSFLGNNATSVTVTPTVSNPAYTITVNGTAVTSGNASAPIALSKGPNTITIVVTAGDGVSKTTYTLIAGTGSSDAYMSIIRLNNANGTLPLSPSYAFKTLNYTTAVGNGTTSVTVTPAVLDATATITVNGTAVANKTASAAIPLNVGPNTITVTGRAQDSITYATYTIVVTRAASNDAYLSNLYAHGHSPALSPTFNFKTLNYTTSVSNGATEITLTASVLQADATVKINGAAFNTATYTAIPLAVGSNTIDIVCTAQDGVTTETYTLTVTRAAPPADSFDLAISVSSPNTNASIIGEDLKVHQGISPNGDGVNDVFTIDNINNYPDNKVIIMDRNGSVIYQQKRYDNSTKAFDGHSSLTGKMQLPGTYFYALEYTVKGVTMRKTGFIVLRY